jgi:hypothetical protein
VTHPTTPATSAVDERTVLSDRAVATLRTAVPAAWGTLVAALLGLAADLLPPDVHDALADVLSSDVVLALVVALVITFWYWLWRRVENHVPDWLIRIVLGSARRPGYALAEVEYLDDGAAVITTLTDADRAAIAACPEPYNHEVFNYCPACPWTRDRPAT